VGRAPAIAERVAGYPQTSLRADRDSVLAAPGRRLEEGLASEAMFGRAAETDDLRRGVHRFVVPAVREEGGVADALHP
jgi:enoyl-CoA hydratase/carnithine racemase